MHYMEVAKPCRFKVTDRQSVDSDFATGPKKAAVFGGRRPPECIIPSFAYPKGTSLCQDTSFKPSAINIGSGVRPADESKRKK